MQSLSFGLKAGLIKPVAVVKLISLINFSLAALTSVFHFSSDAFASETRLSSASFASKNHFPSVVLVSALALALA